MGAAIASRCVATHGPPKHKLKNWRQRLAMQFHTCSYESPSTRPTCTHSRSYLYSLDLMCKTQGERERERERERESYGQKLPIQPPMSISARIMYTLALLFQPVRPTRRPAMHPDSTPHATPQRCNVDPPPGSQSLWFQSGRAFRTIWVGFSFATLGDV